MISKDKVFRKKIPIRVGKGSDITAYRNDKWIRSMDIVHGCRISDIDTPNSAASVAEIIDQSCSARDIIADRLSVFTVDIPCRALVFGISNSAHRRGHQIRGNPTVRLIIHPALFRNRCTTCDKEPPLHPIAQRYLFVFHNLRDHG